MHEPTVIAWRTDPVPEYMVQQPCRILVPVGVGILETSATWRRWDQSQPGSFSYITNGESKVIAAEEILAWRTN